MLILTLLDQSSLHLEGFLACPGHYLLPNKKIAINQSKLNIPFYCAAVNS
jgi:hypothetical protein